MQYCRKRPNAVAQIQGGKEAPRLSGCAHFYQENGCVLIEARIFDLQKESETGFFGFHIHEGEICSGTNFSGKGSHYTLSDQVHPKHAGDLPPLLACQGNAYLSVRTDRFSANEIIGRTMVIHSDPDDFHTQPSGCTGRKIACGVICKRR